MRARTLQMVERWLNLFKVNFVRAPVQLIAAPIRALGIYLDLRGFLPFALSSDTYPTRWMRAG